MEQNNKFIIPAAIVIAGVIVAIAIFYSVGSSWPATQPTKNTDGSLPEAILDILENRAGARLAEKPLKFQLDRFHKDEVMIPQLVTTFFWKPFDLTHPETSKSFNELILFFKSLIPKQPSQAGVIYSLLPNLPIAVAFHVENEVIAAVLTAYEEFGEDSIGALLNFFGIAMAGLFGPGSANKPIRVVHDDRMRGDRKSTPLNSSH